MRDFAIRVLSALHSFASTGVDNMFSSLVQLREISYGNKSGTEFVRYDYGGHDRTFGHFYFNDKQTLRRVLKLAHQYRFQLLKIADFIGGSSNGAGQGKSLSQYDGGSKEMVHSRARLANHPVLEMLASNLWIRLGLLIVLCLGAFMYCLNMMEQQQAEIAGRGTNWWADMSPLTSAMSSGSSSAAATSIPPSTPGIIEESTSGETSVGLGVQLPEESVPESTIRDASSRPSISRLLYFTRQDASSQTAINWSSLATLISTVTRSTTSALALTSGTTDMSDNSENNDGTHSNLESSLDSHPHSLLQSDLIELSDSNSETRVALHANNDNSHEEIMPITKSRGRSTASKYGLLTSNRVEETRNKVFSRYAGGSVSSNSSAGSSRTGSRRQSVVSFACSTSITKQQSAAPTIPDNIEGPITTARQLGAVSSDYFCAMALIYYSYPYMYTFFRHDIPSSFSVSGGKFSLSSSYSRAMSGLRSTQSVSVLSSRNTRDRQVPSRLTLPHFMRTWTCIQRRQSSTLPQMSNRSRRERDLGRFIRHQHVSGSVQRNPRQQWLNIRRSRVKLSQLSATTSSSSLTHATVVIL